MHASSCSKSVGSHRQRQATCHSHRVHATFVHARLRGVHRAYIYARPGQRQRSGRSPFVRADDSSIYAENGGLEPCFAG